MSTTPTPRPTPETDAASYNVYDMWKFPHMRAVVDPDVARKLEIERNEAREQLADIRQRLKGHPDSRLDGEHGLAAATMRGFEGFQTENEAMRHQLEWLWSNCKIIHWPKRSGVYPIEHAPAAKKDARWLIEAEMAGQPIGSQSPSLQVSQSDPTPPNPSTSSPDPGE